MDADTRTDAKIGRRVAALTRTAARLARRAAAVERAEDERAAALLEVVPHAPAPPRRPRPTRTRAPRDALLIINAGAGPHDDAGTHVRELVEHLGAHGIRARVRIIQRAADARQHIRAAARAGRGLVIAAGGDGTVEAVARDLVKSGVTLGIIPLGTYNNVATCLGIPRDVRAARSTWGWSRRGARPGRGSSSRWERSGSPPP
jgi:hypothetical protein